MMLLNFNDLSDIIKLGIIKSTRKQWVVRTSTWKRIIIIKSIKRKKSHKLSSGKLKDESRRNKTGTEHFLQDPPVPYLEQPQSSLGGQGPLDRVRYTTPQAGQQQRNYHERDISATQRLYLDVM